MSSSFEKSVKGGTKVKLAPPKSKYVEHILLATQSGEAGVGEVFRSLTHRLRDSTWTVAFKSLIIVHLMIKEGARDVTLSYLSVAPRNRLAINTFTEVQTQGQNIRRYSEYLLARAQAFAVARCDYVTAGESRLKRLTVDKGLLRETELVQDQIRALVKCDMLSNDVENEISLTAFRLLTRDLMDLYNTENEAVMNILSHYFEMSKPDAERVIRIYKKFCSQTDQVVQYLGVARQYEHATRLEIPKIKHAPTGLANSLQEYVDDKDFEVNRRQYLAEQEAKRTGKPVQKPAQPKSTPAPTSATTTAAPVKSAEVATSSQPPKGPAPDLIDFFESIEQNQETMAPNAAFQQQQQGFPAQQQQPLGFQQAPEQQQGYEQYYQPGVNGFQMDGTNPFAQMQQQSQPQMQQQQQSQPQPQPQPIQTQFTGVGFGGYTPQPQQQQPQQPFSPANAFGQEEQQQAFASPVQMQSPASQLQSQQTNPFRQSTMPAAGTWTPPFNQASVQRQSTNPFARSTASSTPPVSGNAFAQQSAFSPPPQQQPFSPQQTQSPHPMQPQPTGTNPFARNITPSSSQYATPPPAQNPLQVQQTGTTNPFRQSAFVNQQTGQGWQNAPQATMGGFESMETIPVFPRPGGGQATGQQQGAWN